VQRARACDFDPRRQVELRLRILAEMGHPTDKVEMIVMGGTFLAAPVEYQQHFIKACYDASTGRWQGRWHRPSSGMRRPRAAAWGLCIETRPDWCGQDQIDRMLEFGATRVELASRRSMTAYTGW